MTFESYESFWLIADRGGGQKVSLTKDTLNTIKVKK